MTLFHCLVSRPQQRGKRESVRRDGGSNPKPPSYLSRHAKYNPASLVKQARETVKSVKVLIEEEGKQTYSYMRVESTQVSASTRAIFFFIEK